MHDYLIAQCKERCAATAATAAVQAQLTKFKLIVIRTSCTLRSYTQWTGPSTVSYLFRLYSIKCTGQGEISKQLVGHEVCKQARKSVTDHSSEVSEQLRASGFASKFKSLKDMHVQRGCPPKLRLARLCKRLCKYRAAHEDCQYVLT
eukprot:16277-Heterococcus_DN1.PRE.3